MGRMGESGNDRERARQAGWRREMGGWRKGGDFPCLAREAVYGGGILLMTVMCNCAGLLPVKMATRDGVQRGDGA